MPGPTVIRTLYCESFTLEIVFVFLASVDKRLDQGIRIQSAKNSSPSKLHKAAQYLDAKASKATGSLSS